MTAATLIRDDDRSSTDVLRDVLRLIETHGHDNGFHQDGKVPLRLSEAIRLAMKVDLGARIMLMSQADRTMYENVWRRLELGLAEWGQLKPLAVWLTYATTFQFTALIDYILEQERP